MLEFGFGFHAALTLTIRVWDLPNDIVKKDPAKS